jgi:hypothetical protein
MPLIDLANPLDSGALAQAAGPFGSSLGGGSFPSSYEFVKRFVNNAKTNNGSDYNGVTALDDPTYLGFSLSFDITSPLFNMATVGFNAPETGADVNDFLNTLNDSPTDAPADNTGALANALSAATADGRDGAIGILKKAVDVENKLGVTFGPPIPATEPPTANPGTGESASAIGYLIKIGEDNRANYLRAFVQGLQEIVQQRPYYFQTITGLLEAFQKSIAFSEDPYTGVQEGEGIVVGCLEAIDLKMTAIFNLYRMACYDVRMKRYVLPKNLMRFDVYVDVHEIRKFKTVRNWLTALNLNDNSPDTKKYVNENTSRIRFKFTECMFNAAASGKVFEGVTNVGGTVATTEIQWSYGLLELDSQYSGYDGALKEDKQQTSPNMKSKLKTFAKAQLANQAKGAINLASRSISSAIQGLTLGNVFGLRNQVLGTLANPQGLMNAAAGAAIQSGELATFGGSTANTSLGDNPLGDATAPLQTINSAKAFDSSTSTLGSLKSISAFGAPGPAQDNGELSSTNIFN